MTKKSMPADLIFYLFDSFMPPTLNVITFSQKQNFSLADLVVMNFMMSRYTYPNGICSITKL